MIQTGNTIVFKNGNGKLDFYWLCEIRTNEYLFFNWYGNPRRAESTDFWKIGKEWFDAKVKDGTIEIYDSLPEKYMDIFEQQAIERNNTNLY